MVRSITIPHGTVDHGHGLVIISLAMREAGNVQGRLNRWTNWIHMRWWKAEFPEAPGKDEDIQRWIQEASDKQDDFRNQAPRRPHRRTLRLEIRSDVVPFYLLNFVSLGAFREKFIAVRSGMWRQHIETYGRIKHPTDRRKAETAHLDYAAGHLDILDRKLGALLQVQGLIGVAVSISVSAFKTELTQLFVHPDPWIIVKLTGVLLVAFLFAAGWAFPVVTLAWIIPWAAGAALLLFFVPAVISDSLPAALIVSFGILWFLTTLLCLRGAGRTRWGAMIHVDNRKQLEREKEYQLNEMIRAIVGRTAIYRTAVLLVFTNLYVLAAIVCVSAWALSRGAAGSPGSQPPPAGGQSSAGAITFPSGKTCDDMPDLPQQIQRLGEEVLARGPTRLVISGSADAVPFSGSERRFGNNCGLALSRGYCVAGRITEFLRVRGRNIPVEVSVRDAREGEARVRGSAQDRTVTIVMVGGA